VCQHLVLVLPSFWMFSWTCSLLLQNLSVTVLINHVAWRDKFLMNSAQSKKNMLLVVNWLTSLSLDVEWTGFSTERRFLSLMCKHRFCLLFWPLEEVLVIFYLIFLAHKHTPLFLLVSEQSRHRFCRDVPHIQILH